MTTYGVLGLQYWSGRGYRSQNGWILHMPMVWSHVQVQKLIPLDELQDFSGCPEIFWSPKSTGVESQSQWVMDSHGIYLAYQCFWDFRGNPESWESWETAYFDASQMEIFFLRKMVTGYHWMQFFPAPLKKCYVVTLKNPKALEEFWTYTWHPTVRWSFSIKQVSSVSAF